MPYVFGVLNKKGGAAKTTTSINLACGLAERKNPQTGELNKVLLVDADEPSQVSCLKWTSARAGDPLFPVIGMPEPTIHKELPLLAKDFDFVIIDGPPKSVDQARSIIMASDMIIIPVQPSPLDVWASKSTVDLVVEAKIFKEHLKSAFLITRKIANTALGRDVADALAAFPLPILEQAISQRVAFAESIGPGLSIFEYEPDGKAVEEVRSMINELIARFVQ